MKFVMQKLKDYGIHEHSEVRLVGFGADGAANMMGKRTGLGTQLKENYFHIVIVHGIAWLIGLN